MEEIKKYLIHQAKIMNCLLLKIYGQGNMKENLGIGDLYQPFTV